MNILFLDFDGVICTTRAGVAVNDSGCMGYLDPIALGLLSNIVRKYEVHIVISSTWRYGKDSGYFRDLFKAAGFNTLAKAVMFSRTKQGIWRTPKLDGECRGQEIYNWMEQYSCHPDDNYVILDDDSDMLPEQKEHFVHCSNTYDGILFTQYLQCCHVFDGKPLSTF